mmetsp:Transcript_20542/g.31265  ORF Transcript_20542/g.31265 Transcript_20542/m.31265 type:complete len:169 (+) Transcript_20542:758-1264(+)|eukprot:CAMPEP_0170505002 /NCGR_PEP_ID=MMETSP0208-20121228/49547_1 /TAXON_ID=197538 /ORGANISM="Strombidium inclinatum, Strain S3" /LENGTH=168 /DNA_ID=CAMNT_0010785583 /DNA_START=698 /DNA_END=1204 /DNA_ORIENTATION=+
MLNTKDTKLQEQASKLKEKEEAVERKTKLNKSLSRHLSSSKPKLQPITLNSVQVAPEGKGGQREGREAMINDRLKQISEMMDKQPSGEMMPTMPSVPQKIQQDTLPKKPNFSQSKRSNRQQQAPVLLNQQIEPDQQPVSAREVKSYLTPGKPGTQSKGAISRRSDNQP